MNIYSREHQVISARLTYQPANLSNFPSSVEISDAWNQGGSGVGNGTRALRSAVGEFYERRHFYRDVVPDLTGGLDYSLEKVEISKFIQAFTQTHKQNVVQPNLTSHQYNLSQVFRASNLSSCHIPTACIALSTTRTETENSIYPLRDTCGCAFGWHPEQAIFGSIKEFLERQFLTRFWLTGECIKIIEPLTASSALAGTCTEMLCKALMLSGELSFIDLSDIEYSGVCILAVYGHKSSQHNVQYCAGMAYAATSKLAMEKSLLELWQTYRFIDSFIATEQKTEEIRDSYLKHFLLSNNYDTYRTITSVHSNASASPSPFQQPLRLKSLLTDLTKHQALGYIYLKMIPAGDHFGYCSKFISPDFFIHMNNSQNFNLNNLYSQTFLHEIKKDREPRMVPFP